MSTMMLDEEATQPRAAARWGQYARWQLRDYAFGAGGATLGVAVLALAMTSTSTPVQRPVGGFIIGGIGLLGSIFAVNGLVSTDRARGWYRFAFAKPAMPWRYYAQAFAVRGAGLLAITAIAWALLGLFGASLSLGGALVSTTLYFALFGGVTLLLSVVTRHEWLATLAAYAAGGIALSMTEAHSAAWRSVGRLLHWVLPPFHHVHTLGALALGSPPYAAATSEVLGTTLWIIGYSAAAVAAAMLFLRRREWAK